MKHRLYEVDLMKRLNTNLINWTVACVNEFARNCMLSPRDAFRYLYTYGGIEFLKNHYESEHLLSLDDTVEDLLIVCRSNGGSQ